MRNGELIRSLAVEHEVHLFAITWQPELHYLPANQEHCASVDYVLNTWSNREAVGRTLRSVLAGRPLATTRFYVEEAAGKIHRFLLENDVDLIVFAESLVAPYMDAIPRNCRARTIIDFHNIASEQYRTMTRMSLGGLRQRMVHIFGAMLMRKWEGRYARRADHCLVVSDQEAQRLRRHAPRVPVSVVPNGVHPAGQLHPTGVLNTLLFVGTMGYAPNADAVRYFCCDILGLIRRRVPGVRLYIVGLAPPAEVRALEGTQPAHQSQALANALSNVVVTGEVRDVHPYYENTNVVIVPLRAGGGTRIKILEAMALGRPVVSTSLGCEGLEVRHREHLMIADDPEGFANSVTELLENPQFAQQLCRNARSLVENRYDWALAQAQFSKICNQLCSTRASAPQAILEGVQA